MERSVSGASLPPKSRMASVVLQEKKTLKKNCVVRAVSGRVDSSRHIGDYHCFCLAVLYGNSVGHFKLVFFCSVSQKKHVFTFTALFFFFLQGGVARVSQ